MDRPLGGGTGRVACRPAQADANALAVHIATGAGATLKLGYLPREAAAALAPMVRLPRPTCTRGPRARATCAIGRRRHDRVGPDSKGSLNRRCRLPGADFFLGCVLRFSGTVLAAGLRLRGTGAMRSWPILIEKSWTQTVRRWTLAWSARCGSTRNRVRGKRWGTATKRRGLST